LVSLGIHVESDLGDILRLEYDPNRPDYSTDYGIARAVKGKLGLELGLPKHKITHSEWEVLVDSRVKSVRPFIVAMIARGLNLDEEDIRQLIGMQEDLHEGLGRKRRKLAIGLHDTRLIKPYIRYSAVDSNFKFIPLNSQRKMTVLEILRDTEQGKKYSALLEGKSAFPILVDKNGVVLSLPPIINGSATMVTTTTRELFIDVTGHDLEAMKSALAIISEVIWDMGASVESVKVVDGKTSQRTPDTTPRKATLSKDDVFAVLGIDLPVEDIKRSLLKTRFDVSIKGNRLIVTVPRYRVDILHKVDLVEEVGYGFGYENLTPDTAFPYSKGRISSETVLTESFRRLAVGLGFQEVMTFSLKSLDTQYINVGKTAFDGLRVESSKTKTYEYLRDSLTPGILEVLGDNVHEPYPQKLFEIGVCFRKDPESETGVGEETRIAGAIAADVAPFSDIKSVVDSLIEKIYGCVPSYSRITLPYLLDGRAAAVSLNRKQIGNLGEVKPSVLRTFKIKMPVSVFELSIRESI
jgi:phenylalanyl-tRNA synthetase beta chain